MVYIQGQKSGEFKYYYDTNELSDIIEFDNTLSGIWKKFWLNGKLMGIGRHINMQETGEWKFYFENEQLESIGNYKNGKQNGEWKFFDDKGKLIEVENY